VHGRRCGNNFNPIEYTVRKSRDLFEIYDDCRKSILILTKCESLIIMVVITLSTIKREGSLVVAKERSAFVTKQVRLCEKVC
jgi:hypothetical protein